MKKLLIYFALGLLLTGCFSKWGNIVAFNTPDIKDDFCGVHINYQYCKCAFHNDFCDAIGMDKRAANEYVQSEYQKWLKQQLDVFSQECATNGGFFDDDSCYYCKESDVVKDGDCVSKEEVAQEFKPDGPLTDECTIKTDEYDVDWKKYSDIDNAIAFEDRSYEAKQALVAYETMIDKMVEAFAIERDLEIEQEMIDELQTYRDALVQNLKTNLLKSFWRLAWITYSTIDSTKSLKGSYEKIFDGASVFEQLGAGLKIVRSGIPSNSSLAIDTSTITGKVKSSGASVALDAVESLGDPVTVVTTLFQEAANQSLPSADITDEEVAILKNQQETKGVIDEILAESKAANEARRVRMAELETDIAALQQQVDEWEAKEKDRVKNSLEESCSELKRQFNSNQ